MEIRRTLHEQLALYDHLTVEHGALAPVTQADALAIHDEAHRYDGTDHAHADESYTDAELRVAQRTQAGSKARAYVRWVAYQDQKNRDEVAA